ncbi:MAG: ABC transporter permease [Archangium gephyra]|uniref:ABC transporter permease n=1 Tax=Archangium gephyra TaxID=48 RepID=A0A2W5SX87_9BACT|nr:MAG: ABC transporter permease [Archangium gephyra]
MILALMLAGFREALRNRITVVVGVFAGVLILLTTLVMNTTVFTIDRAVTDFGLGVMALLMAALSMFLSVGTLSREIEKRTVFLVMSRPISRTQFVVGRYLGMMTTLTVLLAAMAFFYGLQLLLFGVQPTGAMGAALLGLWVELFVLAALGLLLSASTGQLVGALSLVGVYLMGHLSPDLFALSQRTDLPGLARACGVLYALVPNLDRLDYRVEAAWESTIELPELLSSCGVGAAWALLFVTAASLVFSRRDFR